MAGCSPHPQHLLDFTRLCFPCLLVPGHPAPHPQQNSCFPSCNRSLLPFSSRPPSSLKAGPPAYFVPPPDSLVPSWPWKDLADKRLAGGLHL